MNMGLLALPGCLLQLLLREFLDWRSQVCCRTTCTQLKTTQIRIRHVRLFWLILQQETGLLLDEVPLTALEHVRCLNVYCELGLSVEDCLSRGHFSDELEQVNFFGVVVSELPWLCKFMPNAPAGLKQVGLQSRATFYRVMESDWLLLFCQQCLQRHVSLHLDFDAFARQEWNALFELLRFGSLPLPRLGSLDMKPPHSVLIAMNT
jgi:hypothetical protein